MQCERCGTVNRDGVKFCEECGAPFVLLCPTCGAVTARQSKFCGTCGAPLPHRSVPPAARLLSGTAAMEGERKIVTVLFADITGSMAMMEDLDPEEAKAVLDPCLQVMIDAVHRAEGTVNRLLGDGLMALFGAPLALEEHPHHALHAALQMHDAVRRYAQDLQHRRGLQLQIRVGVHTGEVVVRTLRDDLYMDYSAVGHTVGLAARMESLAPPGSTFVTVQTYRLTRTMFHFAARGKLRAKGVKDPVEVYELLGSRPVRSRLAARAARGFSPFVGRTRELSELRALLRLAGQGCGQVIALVGEAGVGKSRLLEELKPLLREVGFLVIEGEGFAYGKTRAYLPLVDMLKRYCELTDHDPPEAYRDKLHTRLTAVDASLAAYTAVLLELFGIPSEDPQATPLRGEAKRQKVLEGIKKLIALQSRRQPVALIVEDLHWLDPHSLTFLHALITGIAALPVVFLFSYRPGQTYPWETLSFAHRLQIAPLPHDASVSLFTALVGTDPEVATLAPLVCAQSGGNPFFLEEIVQSLAETGALVGQPRAYALGCPATKWSLPATVHGVLASRLDRLAPTTKALLQTAAVIGRQFSRPLLTRVAQLPDPVLDQALADLQAREFVYETAVYPELTYTFKHALTQEVAYHSLLRERRAELHAAVGAAVESLYADTLAEYVPLLAHHYSQSTQREKALQYLQLAAQRAFDFYADSDALQCWEEYLRILATLPGQAERDRQEVRARIRMLNVLSRQNSGDEALRSQFDAALSACQRLGDDHLLAELHATLAVAYVLRGRPKLGLAHARTAKRLAEVLADPHLQVITPGPLAHLLWIAGRFADGLRTAEEGLALLQQHHFSDADAQLDFVASPYVQCLAIAGACAGFLGDFDRGLQLLREAAHYAHQHGNRIPQALSQWGLALLYALRGDVPRARQEADRALTLMREVSSATGVLLTGSAQEYLAAHTSLPVPSSPPSTACLQQTWQGRHAFFELAGIWLADLALLANRLEEALHLAREALVQAEASESWWFLCLAHLTLGKILSQTRAYADAQAHLLQAQHYAGLAQSPPLQAHTLLEMGEMLWQRFHTDLSHQRKTQDRRSTDSVLLDSIGAEARQRARESLTRAVATCTQLGMPLLAQRAHTLLTQLDTSKH
ncbi:MAG: AAA family ATPase [Candidatus Binatia bacterium]|nr:AAA family ATPase [Candidatus Binatia bacterium]